jgi:hypothetical protein
MLVARTETARSLVSRSALKSFRPVSAGGESLIRPVRLQNERALGEDRDVRSQPAGAFDSLRVTTRMDVKMSPADCVRCIGGRTMRAGSLPKAQQGDLADVAPAQEQIPRAWSQHSGARALDDANGLVGIEARIRPPCFYSSAVEESFPLDSGGMRACSLVSWLSLVLRRR